MDELVAFVQAILAREEPSDRCGCLDANHVPACTPQPWKDRKRRKIAAVRATLAAYDEAVNGINADIGVADAIEGILRHVAAIWNDEPGYRDKWKP